jgi:NAD(P)-dependent dehydrogenase (short-subunit alcohol dehydrogenase family)
MVMGIPDFSVRGKVTVVTGAGRGIGKALALGFAEAGSAVVLVARTESELEEAARTIEANDGRALAVRTDVTKRDQVNRMIEAALRQFGRIDVLINVAGGAGDIWVVPALYMGEESYDQLQERNLKSVFLCCQSVASVMIQQKKGSIINISSMSGAKPVALEAAVGAFKAGVNQLTRALAVAWASSNVRVNAIAPGLTLTDRVLKKFTPDIIEKFSNSIPMGRAAEPEDHLGPAMFLASDASAFITGVVMPSDGGPQ